MEGHLVAHLRLQISVCAMALKATAKPCCSLRPNVMPNSVPRRGPRRTPSTQSSKSRRCAVRRMLCSRVSRFGMNCMREDVGSREARKGFFLALRKSSFPSIAGYVPLISCLDSPGESYSHEFNSTISVKVQRKLPIFASLRLTPMPHCTVSFVHAHETGRERSHHCKRNSCPYDA